MTSTTVRPTPRTSSTTHRPALTVALVAGLVVLPAAAASAHVRVGVDDASGGAYSVMTFRVPNESDTAGTTEVAVQLPTDTPITFVSVEPVPGWTAEVVRGDLPEPVTSEEGTVTRAVLSVTWTADEGVQIGPDEFQRFVVVAGPLPAEGTDVVLPTTQTYSDGEVVAWDEPVAEGQEEPEFPAPSFTTVAASTGEVGTTTPVADDGATATAEGDTTARWLGAGGLALGVVALLVAFPRGGSRRRPAR